MENTILTPIDEAALAVGGRTTLAELLGVTVSAIGNWKVRGVPLEQCMPIERVTNGKVTRRRLRPYDWMRHWPELAQVQIEPAQVAINTVADAQAEAITDQLLSVAAQAGLIERRSFVRRAEDRAMREALNAGKVG